MKVISSEMMRDIDTATIEGRGIPGLDLMERAGEGVASRIIDLLGDTRGKNVSIFCGNGNNGGDGFVVARALAEAEIQVKVFLLCAPEDYKGDSAHNLARIPDKVAVMQIGPDDDITDIREQLAEEDIVVDALLGTGIKGPVKPNYVKIINAINECAGHVVSVDIPSGVEGSTGRIGNIAVKADHTVTMAVPKLGLFLQPGNEYAGDISVVDIGVPDDVFAKFDFKYDVLNDEDAKCLLPPRGSKSHKGDFGKVLIIGGSRGMSGAMALASMSAMRSGAGMVVAACPKHVQKIIAMKLDEVMTLPLDENSAGTITPDAVEQLMGRLEWADVVAIGPGIGINDDVLGFMQKFLKVCDHPLIIDADAIKCVASLKNALKDRTAPTAITPHPGEMAYFLGRKPDEILNDYFHNTTACAKEHGLTVLLKVHRSVTASCDGRATINVTGNDGMATAGSGDVLTGMIAGFLAQSVNKRNANGQNTGELNSTTQTSKMYDAVRLGAYMHGLAGDLAEQSIGRYSLIAGDLIRFLPNAFRRVITGE
jgi:hydroxyethylthiazole kinase-like uncharacterized protein yjeF